MYLEPRIYIHGGDVPSVSSPQRLAGGENVGFSNGTFLSERENADRNYSLGYYMRENKCFPDKCDLMSSLDLYFQVSDAALLCHSRLVRAKPVRSHTDNT